MTKLVWLIEVAIIILLSLPIAVLPYRAALKVGEILGILVFYIWASRRRIAVENIEKAKGEWQMAKGKEQSTFSTKPLAISHPSTFSLAKKNFKNLGRSFVEVIKIYYGLGKRIIENVEIRGAENYHRGKSKNKGVIFITGHCGNWELLAIAFGIKVDNISVVARQQNNPYLNKIVEKIRARYGNNVIYKKGALKGILSELHRNKSVGILMDQSVFKDEGYVVDFLGRPAWTTKMPALIARKTGAAVLPTFINRNGYRHIINIHPEVELTPLESPFLTGQEKTIIEDTKRFSNYIEDYIRQYPEEWLWIHRRWKRT